MTQLESEQKEVTLSEALELAATLFREGNLDTAHEVCTQILKAAPDQPDGLHLMALILARKGETTTAIGHLERAVEARPDDVELLNNLGNLHKFDSNLDAAEKQYNAALKADEKCYSAHYNLGTVHEARENLQDALQSYKMALSINEEFPLCHYNLGNLFNNLDDMDQAVVHYRRALELEPGFIEAAANLGSTLLQMNRLDEAIECYERVIKEQPESPELLNNLGIILTHKGRLKEAVNAFQEASRLQPDFAEAQNNLGLLLRDTGHPKEAAQIFQKVTQLRPDLPDGFSNLADSCLGLHRYDEAVKHYKKAISLRKDQPEPLNGLGIALANLGYYDNAGKCFMTAQTMRPGNQTALLGICMISLTENHKTEEDVFFSRRKYLQVLEKIAPAPPFNDPMAIYDAALAIGTMQPFYLAAQGQNDVEMQRIYGGLVSRVMTQRYAEFSQALAMPKLDQDGRIKVGIISRHFNANQIFERLIRGILSEVDRKQFKIYCYSTGCDKDEVTDFARGKADEYHEDMGFEQLIRKVHADKLHVLLYPEIGIDPVTLKASALRLAPVQCMAWGHPETSGIENVDYFLSSDLMEPEQSHTHYTEKLVRLPNLGMHYVPPSITPDTSTMQNWGLRPDDTKYLCCQPLHAYLPQHDKVLAAIAKAVPDSQFVFVKTRENTTKILSDRLHAAFEERKVAPDKHLVFLPPLSKRQYAALYQNCDIYLDSLSWSGCDTALEALRHGLPVVTKPGPIMRGRHANAFLEMADLKDTIAADQEEYILTASKLGRDIKLRKALCERIAANHTRLYKDRAPITALEEFLSKVVTEALAE